MGDVIVYGEQNSPQRSVEEEENVAGRRAARKARRRTKRLVEKALNEYYSTFETQQATLNWYEERRWAKAARLWFLRFTQAFPPKLIMEIPERRYITFPADAESSEYMN